MLHIYLDQNKWVDLARAATGKPQGARFADALTMASAAVESGAVCFPLDMYRYWETSKRGDSRSRNDVVDIMRELSRGQTMALPFGLLDQELDEALLRWFGRPTHPRQQQVFGLGMRHIAGKLMDWPGLDLSTLPDGGASMSPAMRAQLEEWLYSTIEEELHRAGPQDLAEFGFDFANSDHAKRFVEFENILAGEIAKKGLTGDLVDLAVRGADLGDIKPPLTEALERIGMTFEQFATTLGEGGLVRFIDDLPTRYVTNVMRSAKHRQSQQPWELNDFIDIVALPVAAVFCDIVVTEKQWAHRLRQGKVGERYGTVLINDVADLTDILVNAATP
ncbi:hypothetical protein GCM10011492_11360 [Flexivirga endophytica]|uniref:Uncharacterized protein n=1 Tax=Flexivirga endophytica TaxID=1849103 RepID=A0A916WRK7_9MICO|nr:hypothetical protein [Flexivirga endophytica]GGB23232.1 hypothetical protein GCM10011492_11360 [Flexivirga endophytica]GHB57152.1 hypothetical protein GCM10008112_27900 [Flexivirga endophytica]